MLPTMNGDYSHWLSTNVRKQKQAGYCFVTATIPLGDFTSQQMRILGDLATAFADGMIRITAEQDLVFRWVRADSVAELYRQLAAAGMGLAGCRNYRGRDELPGRRVVQARRDAVARPRKISGRSPARASRACFGGARSPDQDQWLPERLRP